MLKFTTAKFAIILRLSLITQGLIPTGWKLADNFQNEKTKTKKNCYKTQNSQKNYKTTN